MLRLRRRLLQNVLQRSRSINQEDIHPYNTSLSSSSSNSIDAYSGVFTDDSLLRYIPTDSQAFLVENHRLTPAENATQKVTAFLPWILFGLCAVSPFAVMKYNLEKMEVSTTSADKVTTSKPARHPFRAISFQDIQDILQRRTMTLLNIYDDSFHSQVLVLAFREIDRLFLRHGIEVGVCVLPFSSSSDSFKSKYPTGPLCQLLNPSNGTVVDFAQGWSTKNLVEFVLPPSRITACMETEIDSVEAKLGEFRKCLFAKRFLDKKHTSWTVQDSVESESVDVAIARCRAL
jgi:hypothetical protein